MHYMDYRPHKHDSYRVIKANNTRDKELELAFHWDDVLMAYVMYLNHNQIVIRKDQVAWFRDKLNEVALENTVS